MSKNEQKRAGRVQIPIERDYGLSLIHIFRAVAAAVVYIGMFLISVAYLVTDTFNPFLYFRF